MRAGILIGTIGGLAGFAVAALGQAPPKAVMAGGLSIPEAYDNSQADRRLQAFDKAHPTCAVWTDWRKLCVRRGPNGATVCDIDASHPTSPSAPFCVREIGHPIYTMGTGPRDETRAELQSRLRFSHPAPDRATDRVWQENRPFNGRDLEGFAYPGCRIWSYRNARQGGQDDICATDRRPGIRACPRHPAIVPGSVPICTEVQPGSPCAPKPPEKVSKHGKSPDPSRDRSAALPEGFDEGDAVLIGPSPEIFPVYGFKCPQVK